MISENKFPNILCSYNYLEIKDGAQFLKINFQSVCEW